MSLPALRLLAQAARQSPDAVQPAATPHAVELLAQFIGSSEADLQASWLTLSLFD